MVMKPVARWTADADGVAHAHGRRATRTACGQPAIDPKFGWPSFRTCSECVAVIKRETGFELPAAK